MIDCVFCNNPAHFIMFDGGWYICVSCVKKDKHLNVDYLELE
jgi:hypothetical protein